MNLNDLAILLSNYNQTDAGYYDGDIDPYDDAYPGDGDIDLADLAEMLSQYGDNCNWPR